MKFKSALICMVFFLFQSAFCFSEVIKEDVQEPEHLTFGKKLLSKIESGDKATVAEMTKFPFIYDKSVPYYVDDQLIPEKSGHDIKKMSKPEFIKKFNTIFTKDARKNLVEYVLAVQNGIIVQSDRFNYKKYKMKKDIPVYEMESQHDGEIWLYFYYKTESGYKLFALEYDVYPM